MNKISVFMPCYNVEKYVSDCIDSILAQTYNQFELIIVDDGSTDSTIEICKRKQELDSRIKIYENEKNLGLPRTRNRMFELCSSEYIAIMDSDDLMPLNRLEVESKYLDLNPDVIAVGGAVQIIDENGEYSSDTVFNSITYGGSIARLMIDNAFANGTMMIRREEIIKSKVEYDIRFSSIEDYKFWTDCIVVGKMVNLNQIMLYYRVRKDSVTAKDHNQKKRCSELYDIIHSEYIKKLCNNCFTQYEIDMYIRETKKIIFSETRKNIIDRLLLSIRFQKFLSKVYSNCKYSDDDFKLELVDLINKYSSQTVYKILNRMGLIAI